MNDKRAKAVTQYLQRHAEAETTALTDWPAACHYQHTLLIPAYKETPAFLQNLFSAPWFRHNVLVILIINQPDTQADTGAQQLLADYATRHSTLLWQSQNLSLLAPQQKEQAGGHLLLVNRFQQPIPAKQGVGLARKIGADLALALIDRGIIHSDWICSSDADAVLPEDYFFALETVCAKQVAACYSFKHIGSADSDIEVTEATLLYERAMRYYVAGLRYAGSPYAHFTIGSTLAFRAIPYAKVRGFPKRAAGEDFYLLNKLIKLGTIAQLPTTIQLRARLSERVPFGTGVSTAHIVQLTRQNQPFHYYHPQTFIALREVLVHFDQLWESNSLEQWLQQLPENSAQALLKLGIASAVEKQKKQCRSKQQFDRQLVNWFDGLKTLQFVHLLRDTCYANLPLSEAIQQAVFMDN